MAAMYGLTEIVKILTPLTDNPNESKSRCTPIHWAVCGGHTEIVRILAALAKNPNETKKVNFIYGYCPISKAYKNGNMEMVKILASDKKKLMKSFWGFANFLTLKICNKI